jgi:hypothetical protein
MNKDIKQLYYSFLVWQCSADFICSLRLEVESGAQELVKRYITGKG